MTKIYAVKSMSGAEEYIQLKGEISDIKIPVMKSEIQYLDKKKVRFDVLESGGLEIPDLISYEGIFLVSNRLKQLLDFREIDYIFWKPADIHSERFGIHETFWIIVPPRIDCIDLEKSELVMEWNFEDGLLPMLSADKIVILPELLGRFQIFKVLGVMDNNIYVTEELYKIMTLQKYEGIVFSQL